MFLHSATLFSIFIDVSEVPNAPAPRGNYSSLIVSAALSPAAGYIGWMKLGHLLYRLIHNVKYKYIR